jgi:CRISPR/Cas system-associated exonuclease Cas4 (RecB family)
MKQGAVVSIAADRPGGAQTMPGELLSPSQVSTYLECAAKWWFKYGMNIPDPAGAGAVRGKALHSIVEYWMTAKMQGVLLEPAGVADVWGDAWEESAADALFHDDDDVPTIKAAGAKLAAKYIAEVGPSIEPAAVEFPVTGRIGGVAVRGFVDLMDTAGRIIDIKTSSRKSSKVTAPQALQLATYAALAEGASGETRVDTLVSTKDPQLVQLEYAPGAAGRRLIERLYPMAAEGMRAGLYTPNRASTLCSKRYCRYASLCEGEFGGCVE